MNTPKVVAHCRKVIGSLITILRTHGLSYVQIEEELKLRPNHGMTAWRLEGNKHQDQIPD